MLGENKSFYHMGSFDKETPKCELFKFKFDLDPGVLQNLIKKAFIRIEDKISIILITYFDYLPHLAIIHKIIAISRK